MLGCCQRWGVGAGAWAWAECLPAAGFFLLHDRLSLLPGCVSLDVVGGRLGSRLVDSLLFGGLFLGVHVLVSDLLFSGRLCELTMFVLRFFSSPH